MEMNLSNPKAVLANEAFPKDSPRPACVVPTFSSIDELKKLGEGKDLLGIDSFRPNFYIIVVNDQRKSSLRGA